MHAIIFKINYFCLINDKSSLRDLCSKINACKSNKSRLFTTGVVNVHFVILFFFIIEARQFFLYVHYGEDWMSKYLKSKQGIIFGLKYIVFRVLRNVLLNLNFLI